MRTSPFVILLLCLFALAGRADTIYLTSGERLDGKVLSETDTEVVMDVQVSAGVRDERTIAKSEIASVEKESPAEAAYREVDDYQPGPTNLPADDYEKAITALSDYLTAYPDSPHAADVQRNLTALTAEKALLDRGQVKFGGRWLSLEEVELHRADLDAQRMLFAMRDDAESGDLISALNTFAQFEQTLAGSRVYPEAVELALQVLAVLQREVDRDFANLKAVKAARMQSADRAVEPEKSQILAAIKAEDAQDTATLAAADKARVKWKPLIPRSEKSLTTLRTQIPSEIKRLTALPLAKDKQALQVMDQGVAALDAKQATQADRLFAQAATLWPGLNTVKVWQGKTALASTAVPKASAAPSGSRPVLSSSAEPELATAPAPTAAVATTQPATSLTAAPSTPVPVLAHPAATDEPILPATTTHSFLRTIPGALTLVFAAIVLNLILNFMTRPRAAEPQEDEAAS